MSGFCDFTIPAQAVETISFGVACYVGVFFVGILLGFISLFSKNTVLWGFASVILVPLLTLISGMAIWVSSCTIGGDLLLLMCSSLNLPIFIVLIILSGKIRNQLINPPVNTP